MKFRVKDYSGKYKELLVTDGGATMESGLLDDAQRRALADSLQEAMDELLQGLEPVSD